MKKIFKLFSKGNRKILSIFFLIVSVFFTNTVVFADTIYTDVSDAEGLKTAIDNGENVKLTASFEISETINITEKDIILDLNGFTITGIDNISSGSFNLFEIFKGKLTISDSVGTGAITLKANTNRYWDAMSTIIENHTGVLNIEGGTFTHLGGSDMAFVVNVNANSFGDATLNIYDGTLYSSYTGVRLFMASIGTTYLNVYGGVLDGDTSAVWAQAPESKNGQTAKINIFDGELGAVNTSRTELADIETVISGGKVDSIKSEEKELKITGGHVEGILNILSSNGEVVDSDEIITGGTFGVDPKGFIASSVTVNASITNGEDSMYAVGEDSVKKMAASAPKGSVIEVSGDVDLEEVPVGVTVKAFEGSDVTANGREVTEDGITIEEDDATLDGDVKRAIKTNTTEHGKFSVDKTEAIVGQIVKVLTTPDVDYELDVIKVLDADGKEVKVNEDGTFVMPDSEVTVTVSFKENVNPDTSDNILAYFIMGFVSLAVVGGVSLKIKKAMN